MATSIRWLGVAAATALLGCGGADGGAATSAGGGRATTTAASATAATGGGAAQAATNGSGGASGAGGGGAGAGGAPACIAVPPTTGWFAATNGTPGGAGTVDDPWDLQTAFYSNPNIMPGDTLWLRGGTYPGAWVAKFYGTPAAPVVIRSYPSEWAALDGAGQTDPTLQIYHHDAIFRDFEVTNSDTTRVTDDRPSGIYVEADDIHLVDLIIHDTGTGVICNSATDTTPELAPELEVYGCILYSNGWQDTDRGHGHDLYLQNRDGTKHVKENVMLDSFGGFGVHAYSDDDTHYVQGFEIVGNVWFEAGAGTSGVSKPYDGCLVGHNGTHPVARVTLRENMGWAKKLDGRDLRMGWVADNDDAHLFDNYLVGTTIFQGVWQTIEMTGNTLIGSLEGASPAAYPSNTYLDAAPTKNQVFVRPNAYQPDRANVVVYNWEALAAVDVDPAGVLAVGDFFELRNASDYFGAPVLSGTYAGGTLSIPMGGFSVAQPIGAVGNIVSSEQPGNAFAAFVLVGGCH